MSEENKHVVVLDRKNELSPRVALFFSMMERTRRTLIRRIETLSKETIDFSPQKQIVETIGTLLLHIAAVEWGWIFGDIAGKEMDYEKWKHGFSLRENIDQIEGKDVEFYLTQLSEVRQEVLDYLKTFDDDSLDVVIQSDDDKVSVEWILFHLIEHEAMHIGQISILRRLWKTHQAQDKE
ncbi:MAG: DinB family protein [Candidatus Thorarchaeota archaeon]